MNKKYLKDFLYILVGNLCVAVAVQYFILPFDILTGGVAGLAVAISPFIPIIDVATLSNILVVGLFILGYFVLGKEFAVKTVVSSILYPIFVTLLGYFPISLNIPPLLASIYTGLLVGVGVGIVIRVGASTGGMDIPPLILNHYTGRETSKFILLCDFLTVVVGLMNYPIESMLTGLISVFISAIVIERIETSYGASRSLQIQIISDHWQEINQAIQDDVQRGATIIDIYGGYKQEPRKMVVVVIDRREYKQVLDILEKVDKNAFVITSDTNQVHGEGFKLSYKD